MKEILILLLVIHNPTNSFAQGTGMDSSTGSLGNVKGDTLNFNTIISGCQHQKSTSSFSDTIAIKLLLQKGQKFFDRRNIDSCLSYSVRVLALSKKIDYCKGIADALLLWGNTICFLKNAYEESRKYFLAAQKICEVINYQKGLSYALGGIGRTYRQLKVGDASFNFYLSSMKAAEASGDKKTIADASYYLGTEYGWVTHLEFARENYLNALKIYEDLHDTIGLIKSYYVLGINASVMNHDYQSGDVYQRKAIHLCEAIHDSVLAAYSYNELGSNEGSRLHYAASVKYLQKATDIFIAAHEHEAVVNCGPFLASIFANEGQKEKAIHYSDKVFEAAMNSGSLILISDAYLSKSKVYFELSDFKEAYQYLFRGKRIRDSLGDIQSRQVIQETATKYETNKKQQQIILAEQQLQKQAIIRNFILGGAALLLTSSAIIFFLYKRRRDSQQKQKEAELNQKISDVEMKALRSQMNPHFIFNSLQSIQNFLNRKNPDEANKYLIKFSKLMRLVLENSLYAEVPLEDDLQSLELYMQLESLRLRHPFTYQINIEEGIDAEEMKIPPLILQPFVENAIWHGLQYKDKPGEIKIFIRRKSGSLICSVEDNGVGMDVSKTLKAPVSTKKMSLGMKITEDRLKILSELKKVKAHFDITGIFDSENNLSGTRIELSLPC